MTQLPEQTKSSSLGCFFTGKRSHNIVFLFLSEDLKDEEADVYEMTHDFLRKEKKRQQKGDCSAVLRGEKSNII